MIIYYDIIADKELASDAFESTSPVKGIKAIQSKKITIQEGEIDIGANAATEATEDDEGVDASEVQSVVNVVYSAKLSKIQIDKKEYKTLQKAYWKKLLDTLNEMKWSALGFDEDSAPPTEKKAAADAEEKAAGTLKGLDKKKYEDIKDRIAGFKANFEALQKFVTDEVLANFDECEFYTVEEGELGTCMIVPARYIGESPAPIFYLFTDGIREKKE